MYDIYNGILEANDIYEGMHNMIISITTYIPNVAEESLANRLRVDGTMYGDTKIYRAMDAGKTYPFNGPSEGANLLQYNPNKSVTEQAVKMNVFRQSNISIEYYLTKQAWLDEYSFAEFTGALASELTRNKAIYDNGIINTFVGTQISTAQKGIVTVPAKQGNTEADNRLFAQGLATAVANTVQQIADNTRAFNEYNFMDSWRPSQLIRVWNAEMVNQIRLTDTPTIWHDGRLQPEVDYVILPKYIGEVNVAAATGNTDTVMTTGANPVEVPGDGVEGAVRSLIEQEIDGVHYFPGEAIKTGSTAPAGTSYTQKSTDVVCKLFPAEAIPFMSGFVLYSNFWNPRGLYDNRYLTFGHNTLVRLNNMPFITIKTATTTTRQIKG